MNTISGAFYEVRHTSDQYGLGHSFDSFDDAMQAINHQWELSRKTKSVLTPWLVVKIEWSKVYSDNGTFIRETKSRIVIAEVAYEPKAD